MPRGGKRPGAGAPKGHRNSAKHGLYANSIADRAERESFQRHFKELQKDPKRALLASAALIYAHAERVIKAQEAGFLHIEKTEAEGTDENGTVSKTTLKIVDVSGPLADVLRKAAGITETALSIEKMEKEIKQGQPTGDTIVIQIHPDVDEG